MRVQSVPQGNLQEGVPVKVYKPLDKVDTWIYKVLVVVLTGLGLLVGLMVAGLGVLALLGIIE